MQIMFCVFAVALGCWCYNLCVYRHNAYRIHYLMTALGVFKVLTLLAQCGMYHYIRITGAPDGWNIAFYIFSLFRGVFLFVVIALIGTGWSYMTPHLGDNNKKVLMLIIPLQVCGLCTRFLLPCCWGTCLVPLLPILLSMQAIVQTCCARSLSRIQSICAAGVHGDCDNIHRRVWAGEAVVAGVEGSDAPHGHRLLRCHPVPHRLADKAPAGGGSDRWQSRQVPEPLLDDV
jgi:hypothetical protein